MTHSIIAARVFHSLVAASVIGSLVAARVIHTRSATAISCTAMSAKTTAISGQGLTLKSLERRSHRICRFVHLKVEKLNQWCKKDIK